MPKLLLADDSITVQRVIALTFQGEGIEVIAVGDGDQAVDAIDRERPQIVLADLSMPGRDGYAVAEYVKRSPELSKDIRVVLLTGAAEPVEEARSRALGIDGVLSKPFEPHVATALVRRLLTRERPPSPASARRRPRRADAPAAETLKSRCAPPPLPEGRRPPRPDRWRDNANAIAVDDYFRRLDEALATAGLSTAPEPAGDLAAIAGPPGRAADRSADAETMIVPRPAPVAADAGPPTADEPGEAPKLVDAFSALLAAEEGDGGPVVAGPVEMEGAPAPVPPPAVEWTPGQTAAAPVEAAAETVALQAVTADAVEAAAARSRRALPQSELTSRRSRPPRPRRTRDRADEQVASSSSPAALAGRRAGSRRPRGHRPRRVRRRGGAEDPAPPDRRADRRHRVGAGPRDRRAAGARGNRPHQGRRRSTARPLRSRSRPRRGRSMRKAFRMSVHPGREAEYARRHQPIWAELEAVLRAHGVREYSIFLDPETRDLFGYAEIDDEARWNAIADTEVCRRWWTSMAPLMPSHPDGRPVSRDLTEVFRLDRTP